MTLLEHLKEAARHLKEATIFVDDWRVREAVAGAGTNVNCAIYLQQKIASGKVKMETVQSFEKTDSGNVKRDV